MEEQQQPNVIHIDFRKWSSKLFSWWWLFAFSIVFCVLGCFIHLRYATEIYSATAMMLIKDVGNNKGLSEENILLSQSFTGGRKPLDNEVLILRSTPIMQKAVEKLGIEKTFYRQGRFKEQEYYKNAPIKLDTFSTTYGFANFYIQLVENGGFLLKKELDEEGGIFQKYGVPFSTEAGKFQISLDTAQLFVPGIYRINIVPSETAAFKHLGKLAIEFVGNAFSASGVNIKLRDPVPEKAKDIIEALIEAYNEAGIKDENRVLQNTMRFIDERLAVIERELNEVEGNIERFRRRNSIVTETAASSKGFALGEMRNTIQQISDFEVQKSLLASVEDFLVRERETFEFIPNNFAATNASLGDLVAAHNEMIGEREQLMKTASIENPVRQALETKLLDNRTLLVETLQGLQKDLDVPVQQLNRKMEQLERSMLSIPGMDQGLLEQRRLQKIQEQLYLGLLQKREETALSIAIATPQTRIIEPARFSGKPVQPKAARNYMTSVLIGLFFPILFISLYELIDTKIASEDTIKSLTSIPIFGRIGHNKSKKPIVVKSGDRSAVNEMFRQLRTNLNYLDLKNEKRIFAVTSYVPGEGKSFVALNLALSFALSDKKTILLELDLRKPRLKKYLDVPTNGKGVTNYLIGESKLEEVIQTYEGLDFISSGPIPPNPTELIASEQMQELLEKLKEQYDCIIIDNPPIGLVTDAMLLRKYINNILVVVRHKYTKRFMLRNVEELNKNGDLPNAGIILNDIKYGTAGYYGYGGYRYGYGQGYYE